MALELVLDSPPVNALDTAMLRGIRDQLAAANGGPVLLVGAGRAFSAGLNLAEVASLSPAEMVDFLDLLEDVVGRLYHHPGPTVSFVHGHAIAGGCVLALACDLRFAAPGRYKVGLTEVALGLQFPPRTCTVVHRRLPVRAHHRLMLGAGLHSPEQALALGVFDAIGTREEAEAALQELAKHPADAYAATKAWLRPDSTPSPAVRQNFVDRVVPAWTSDAVRARIQALLERR